MAYTFGYPRCFYICEMNGLYQAYLSRRCSRKDVLRGLAIAVDLARRDPRLGITKFLKVYKHQQKLVKRVLCGV
jgi:hypothetical protein